MAAIDKFIAKSQEMAARPSSFDDVTSGPDEWDTVAPGVDTADFQPRDVPLPPPPPAIVGPGVDTGRTPNPFLVTTRKDIEDFFAEPGICGLVNLGNTCYMNAGLQCLRSIPCIAQYYWKNNNFLMSKKEEVEKNDEEIEKIEEGVQKGEEETGEAEEINKKEDDKQNEEESKKTKNTPDMKTMIRGHISARLAALIRKIWAGQFSAVIPQTFKTTLGLLYPQFGGYRQQDCQEFLVILLDCLHEDICHYRNMLETQTDTQGTTDRHSLSIITDTFQGQLKNEVTCSVCGNSSVKYDPFVYLSVPIPHSNERQFTLYWSSTGNDSIRTVTKLLVVVPILSTVNDIKVALCLLLDGSVKPDNVVIAHVKNHTIISTLANTLAIKLVNDNEYKVYAFHIESMHFEATPTKDTPTTDTPSSNIQSTDGYELLPQSSEPVPMETDSTPSDPWQPVASEDGLPAKVPRNEETTPLLEEEEEGTEPKVVVMEWHMCVICLEEMVDSDLLTHTTCGATICAVCLEASRRHSGNEETAHMPCPVCQAMVSSVDGFVPLATVNDKSDDIVRLLQLTILFRNESEGVWTLFGHPCLKNIPASSPVNVYYQSILSLLPSQCSQYAWSLALTDGKGQYCSRCVFGSGCHGCILSNAMDDVSLKPGDFLSISFCNLPLDVIEEINNPSLLHPSLETLWPTMVSLQDCLDLFSQREVLGSDNPWWCPKCQANQRAVRQLMISHLPTTLIVHLKRFLFHGNNASKVDTGVDFPLMLSMTSQASEVCNMSLVSCVCHFGSLNSGHYTAFSRQPMISKWHYYNDESVIESQPTQKDSESVYILFYHRESNEPTVELPTERGCTYPSEEEELVQLEPLLRVLKPKPKPSNSSTATPLIKKSSSTGNLNDVSGDNDIQLQQQMAASLGLELPIGPSSVNPSPLKGSSSNPSLSKDDDSSIILKSVRFKAFDV